MVIKSRRVTWAGNVARMGGKRNPYLGFGWNTERRGHLNDSGSDERIILKCILKIGYEGMVFIRLFRDTHLELVGPIKCGKFLEYLKTYSFLVKECVP
jgi:hypothetical protein